jgi:hypothetical protein
MRHRFLVWKRPLTAETISALSAAQQAVSGKFPPNACAKGGRIPYFRHYNGQWQRRSGLVVSLLYTHPRPHQRAAGMGGQRIGINTPAPRRVCCSSARSPAMVGANATGILCPATGDDRQNGVQRVGASGSCWPGSNCDVPTAANHGPRACYALWPVSVVDSGHDTKTLSQ